MWLAAVALGMSGCKRLVADEATCEVAADDRQDVETHCDGIDNDCDGMPDLLEPLEINRCTTDKPGICGEGYYGCLNGEKVCLTSSPVAEVRDGKDNDCNGKVDDVPAVASPLACRVRVAVPPDVWKDDRGVKLVKMLLDQVGEPYDADAAATDWDEGLAALDRYSLLVMPGHLLDRVFSEAHLAAIEAFVRRGGVLIWINPQGDKARSLMDLAGISSAGTRLDVSRVELEPTPATFYLDSVEERQQNLSADKPPEVFLFEIAAGSGAESFGAAFKGDERLARTPFVRRELGEGAIYTLGHNLQRFATRCYVNCYDPGFDLLAMLIKGALRESCQGHFVVKHLVPGVERSYLTITHDVDAPDAQLNGKWGEPGALQMAKMEQRYGVKATSYVTTDVVVDYFSPEMVQGLCDLGICPEGPHGLLHAHMKELPLGDCSVTRATYDPANSPTVCGEINVAFEILQPLVPNKMLSWRTPYLENPPDTWQIIHEDHGVIFDASLAYGDLRTNFPVHLKDYPFQQDWFRGLPMFEFVMTIEDGFGWYEEGEEKRLELKPATLSKFLVNWRYALRQNYRNGCSTVLLVHPSYGLGVGPENLPVKIGAVESLIKFAKDYDILIEQVTPLGHFLRGRHHTKISVSYDSAKGYSGTIEVGEFDAPRFSLEFGDHIERFESAGKRVEIREGRVAFLEPLKANSSHTFTATVKR